MEGLWAPNWTTDPAVWPFRTQLIPSDYQEGNLAQNWEFTDPSTLVVHLRQGVYWQNIAPANGRQFVASDVVYHYDRLLGLGDGFTKPGPYWNSTNFKTMISATANDKYTVTLKFSLTNPELIMDTWLAPGAIQCIECPEAVQQWGNLNDWHHAIGTGPYMMGDYVSGSSTTLVANPNYWGYDERYPQNKLPYISKITYIMIPDNATDLAALRTGKIDLMESQTFQTAQTMKQTNPSIVQISEPAYNALAIEPNVQNAPFNDVRVREAMQMALNLPAIASGYYGGSCSADPSSITSNSMTGWGLPYDQWPQELKDQYAFNKQEAKQLLADAGHPNGFTTTLIADITADSDLMQVVQSYFADVGITMNIQTMDDATFTSYVKTLHKNNALVARPASYLGKTNAPLSMLSSFYTAASPNLSLVSDPVWDAFYNNAAASTTTDKLKQILTQANEYAAEQHFNISLLQPNFSSFYWPWLHGFNAQFLAMASNNPQTVGFYGARYWIDLKLKQSMGY